MYNILYISFDFFVFLLAVSDIRTQFRTELHELRTEFADLKSEVKSINTNIKWIMAIGLLIVGILLKNTFIH